VFVMCTMPRQMSSAHSYKCAVRPVQVVKQRLEKERDLEGIDMGNIVSGGRRSRTGNTATINYKWVCHLRDPTLRQHVHQRVWRGQCTMLDRRPCPLM